MKYRHLLLLGLVLSGLLLLWRTADQVQAAATVILEREERTMQVLTTTWTSAGPLTHTVTTPRKDGEAEDVWCQRHNSAVVALKAVFPPL